MSTKFLSPGWRMPRNANQSKSTNYNLDFTFADASYIDFGNNIPTLGYVNSTDTFSISTWVNTAWQSQYVFGNRDSTSGFAFTTYPSGANYNGLLLRVGSTDIVAKLDRNDLIYNSWVHFVWVYDGSGTNNSDKIKAYQNGIPLSLTFPFGNFPSTISSNLNFYAGAYTWTGTLVGQYEGGLNELSIFDYALSQSQVTTLHGDSTNGPGNPMALPSSPIAYYPLGTSAWNGQYLAENNAIGDYVFDTNGNSSKYFNFPKTSVGSDDFTFSFWVKPKSYAGGGGDAGDTLLGNTNGTPSANQWTMWVYEPDGKIRLVWYNQTNSSGNFMTTDFSFGAGTINQEWVQVVLTRVGTTVTFYFNGVADTAAPGTLSSSSITLDDSSNATMRLPSPWGGTIYNQDGFYSNLLWYNVGLSSTEVEALYNYGSPIQTLANIPQSSNLKAWYKLDASEIYNSSSAEWEVNNSSNPSIYNNFINFNNKWMKVYPIGSGKNSEGGLILPDTYTISLWAKMNSNTAGFFEGTLHTGGFHPAWGNLFRYNAISNGKWRLFNAGSVIYVTSDITDGKWHHILLTYNSSTTTLTVYTDNIQTFNSSSRNYGTGNNIGRIGSGNDGNSNFTGNISNISIWDGVVTTSQRGELYNNGAPKDLTNNSNYSNLKHWYIFNSQETGGRTLIDQKGSNNLQAYSEHTPTFGFINTLAGESSGMSQSNLVQSDLQTVAPYSKYALSFDGTNDYIDCGDVPLEGVYTISFWINPAAAPIAGSLYFLLDKGNGGSDISARVSQSDNNTVRFQIGSTNFSSTDTLTNNSWNNVILIANGSSSKIYINNGTAATGTLATAPNTTESFFIATDNSQQSAYFFNGKLSNVSIWNTALTPSQVREIYNEGLPSNLNTFSGAAPVAWWQLGSNSSWNGNRWIVADEKGTNNGYSQNMAPYMPESGLTNGVGTTSNGTSTGMSESSLVGDAPYSTANAISSGMAVTAKGTNVP